jgi:hypothetical protein
MQLLKQPNHWSCYATSLAMLLDVPVEDIFRDIGHDGSGLDPGGPGGRRGHGGHEIIMAAYKRHAWLVPFLVTHPGTKERLIDDQTLVRLLGCHPGILAGNWTSTNSPHAVAWENASMSVHDPAGPTVYPWRHFNDHLNIEVFFAWMRPRLS